MGLEQIPQPTYIGKTSEGAREAAQAVFEIAFKEDHRERLDQETIRELEQYEIEKTPELVRLFECADQWSQERQDVCGIPPTSFPVRNIFVLDDGYYSREVSRTSVGRAMRESQRIILRERPSFSLAVANLHEMVHMKGRLVYELRDDGKDIEKNLLRSGLAVYSTLKQDAQGEKHRHFSGLEEAVVSQEEVHFASYLLQQPMCAAERAARDTSEGKVMKKDILEKHQDLSEEEIADFDPEAGSYTMFSYPYHRKVLRYVCQEIAEATNSTDNEIYFAFLRGHYTGHLLDLARMMRDAFGEEGFRRLGDMEPDDLSAKQTLEALRKMRLGVLKRAEK